MLKNCDGQKFLKLIPQTYKGSLVTIKKNYMPTN